MCFVREHRRELDAAIRRADPDARYFDDTDRRARVLVDAGLRQRARAEGVQV